MPTPSFLALPPRRAKPRTTGLTHVLDPGVSPATADDVLSCAGPHIDIWKTGWGTAYVDAALPHKLEILARHNVAACLGGTLLEIAWRQGVAKECLAWAFDVGFSHVEVSRGTVPMTLAEKRELIETASPRAIVLSEVGAKDPDRQLAPQQWRQEARSDLDAGAGLVIMEGRQSGTVGIFDASGQVREDVVSAVVSAVDVERVMFEAPRAEQQAWFVRRFGPEVNLGNVALSDGVSVETMRLGLRSDTFELPENSPLRPAGSDR